MERTFKTRVGDGVGGIQALKMTLPNSDNSLTGKLLHHLPDKPPRPLSHRSLRRFIHAPTADLIDVTQGSAEIPAGEIGEIEAGQGMVEGSEIVRCAGCM